MQGVLPYEGRRAKRSSRGVRGYGARLLAVAALLLAAWFVLGVLLDARERGSRADMLPAPPRVVQPWTEETAGLPIASLAAVAHE